MVLVGETMGGNTANSAQRQWSSVCGRSRQSENGAVFGRGTSLSLSLSLSLVSLLFAIYFFNFLNLFARFSLLLRQKFTNFTRFYGLPRSLCSLAMTARHKFKFFTQNSKHFVNSKHLINSRYFINLTQISSHTQGFFIFLPQVFAQFLLINSLQRSSYGRQCTKAPF